MNRWKKWLSVLAILALALAGCGGDDDGDDHGDTTPPTVTAAPPGGSYTAAQSVTLTANEAATIYYTLDGTTPTTASTQYTAAIAISTAGTTALKFFGRDTAGNQSAVVTETYTLTLPLQVSGRVLFDDGTMAVAGAAVAVSLVTEDALGRVRAERRALVVDWTRPDALGRKPVAPRQALRQALAVTQTVNATTGADGRFTVDLASTQFPIRVVAEVSYRAEGLPAVDNARWGTANQSGALTLTDLVIPNPEGREVTIAAGAGQTADGSIRVANLPAEVDRLFAQSYDPGANPAAFPGEFAEMGNIPLNSAVFLWMETFDAQGNPVDTLSQAAQIRCRVPSSQWTDLEDISYGTDRIELPIYVYNETTNLWEQQAEVGWLEDGVGTVLPEDAQSVILDGTFAGELYATYNTTHFSWMNVDYAYIGPWTLSRLDSGRRNDDCLYKALQLAKTIVKSQAGRTTYTKFNVPGGDLDVEMADAAGPELKNSDLDGAYGEFKGNEQGDRDDQLHLDNDLWGGCAAGATQAQKDNTTMLMAITVLHESAHWKWDVKHDGGNWTNAEPGGEAGNELENDLFGGVVTGGPDGLQVNGNPVSGETLGGWLDPRNWPAPANRVAARSAAQETSALQLTIALPKDTFDLGEEIPVAVTYTNTGATAIRVLNLEFLEGYPLWFEIVRGTETERVPFRGRRAKRLVDFGTDFVTLQPQATLEKTFTLLRDPVTQAQRYNLIRSGEYAVTAHYSAHWGLPATASNAVTFTVGAGGSISGAVTSAQTGAPLAGAVVRASQGANLLATATTDATGAYAIPELPAGTYTLEIQASGFLRTSQPDVTVTTGQNTAVNFSLSPLLAAGQLRLVLTWGASPSDLDSHLWLPSDSPFHVYYGNRGTLDALPFANLDVDDTSGFGPETITLAQRVQTGQYVYAIYNFSGSPDITTSGAQVQVFDSTGLIATFNVPTTGTGLWWNVLKIDGATGAITEINTIGDSAAPY